MLNRKRVQSTASHHIVMLAIGLRHGIGLEGAGELHEEALVLRLKAPEDHAVRRRGPNGDGLAVCLVSGDR